MGRVIAQNRLSGNWPKPLSPADNTSCESPSGCERRSQCENRVQMPGNDALAHSRALGGQISARKSALFTGLSASGERDGLKLWRIRKS
jgi:hypothetical protein